MGERKGVDETVTDLREFLIVIELYQRKWGRPPNVPQIMEMVGLGASVVTRAVNGAKKDGYINAYRFLTDRGRRVIE
jgi:DNA-binding MarR family transcriptional regulator